MKMLKTSISKGDVVTWKCSSEATRLEPGEVGLVIEKESIIEGADIPLIKVLWNDGRIFNVPIQLICSLGDTKGDNP